VSLLDRLLDDDPGGPPERTPLRAQSREALAHSVVADLERLLNTRAVVRPGRFPRTVLDFGVEDISSLSPGSPADCVVIAQRLKAAMDAFEPRLQVRRVVAATSADPRRVDVDVDALLLVEPVPEPVSFRLGIRSGRVVVDGT